MAQSGVSAQPPSAKPAERPVPRVAAPGQGTFAPSPLVGVRERPRAPLDRPAAADPSETVLALQRSHGNRFVQRLVATAQREPAPPAPGALPSPAQLMPAIDRIAPSPSDPTAFELTWPGGRLRLTGPQVAELRAAAAKNLVDSAQGVELLASKAQAGYWDQVRANQQQKATSLIAESVGAWQGLEDPRERIKADVRAAFTTSRVAIAMAKGGRLADAARFISMAESQAREADELAKAYTKGLIKAAGSTIKGLEAVKFASSTTLSVLAGFATGGMSLVATSGAVAGISAGYGVAQDFAEQSSEKHHGLREHFDTGALLRRGLTEAVTGFVGGVAGGKLAGVFVRRMGSYLGKAATPELLEQLGRLNGLAGPMPRDAFVTQGQRFAADLLGGTLASPLTTSTRVVLERYTGGRDTLPSAEELVAEVVEDMVKGGAMQVVIGGMGHAYRARSASGVKGPAGNIPEHEGELLPDGSGKSQPAFLEPGVFGRTTEERYLVRAGPAGGYGDHLFTSDAQAIEYAHELAAKGERAIRDKSALPRESPNPDRRPNPVDAIRIFKVPAGTPYISGVVGPQLEKAPAIGPALQYPGGGPQVVIDESVRFGKKDLLIPPIPVTRRFGDP